MSLLSYNALVRAVHNDHILTLPDGEPVPKEQINSASIDITLGGLILVERRQQTLSSVSIARRERINMQTLHIGTYTLLPGEFILAQSREIFRLPPNISAEYKLKSSMARNGLEHLNAGWCDAGWHNSVLTLELKNMTRFHSLEIEAGMPIGQVVFFEHEAVPVERSYAARGTYNNDATVTQAKVE